MARMLHLSVSLRRIMASGALAALLSGAAAADTPAKPTLKFDDSTFDFGNVVQGTKVTHDFGFSNSGTADLVIQRVVPACGCTVAGADSAPIAPGKAGKIHVEFDTTGFAGEKVKTVRVYANDTDNPTPMLTIKGTIEPDVTVEPARISFDELARGGPAEQRRAQFTVRVRQGSGLKIAGVQSLSKNVQIKELDAGESARKVEVTIDPAAPLGELRERIFVNLNGARKQSVNVPVYAMIRGDLQLKPPMLSFGVVDGKDALVRTAKLESSGNEAVKITAVSSNSPAVTASYSTVQPGKLYLIKVTVDPAKIQHDLRAAIEVRTDAKDEGTLTLNVYGITPPKVP
jgi:hypothetical protein